MYVYDIVHKFNNTHTNKIYNTIYPKKILYEKYKIIECDNYNEDTNTIYTTGIHYYKNYKRAFYEENEILVKFLYSGHFIEYDGYGQKIQEGAYINGVPHGNWTIYKPLHIINQNDTSLYQLCQLEYYRFFGNTNYIIKSY